MEQFRGGAAGVPENPEQGGLAREQEIVRVSVLGIILNLLIAASRIVLGFLTSSIAIMSEGVNNAMDALTSALTLVGTKLSRKHPDSRHPFGYGRIEYLTSLTVAVIIIVAGAEMMTESVKLIIKPQKLSVSLSAMAIVGGAAVVKFFLGVYTIRTGKRTGSGSLAAIGLEGRNDSLASVLTIASAAIYLALRISIDAYVGIVMAVLILKAGLEVLKDTVSELLGRPGQKELADELYRKIRRTPGILGAADMMLHNYGPGAWSGSVNIEIDHRKNIGEIYGEIHRLQLEIMQE